ncbi:hypothetical protein NDU88_001480 [Pleurodeles waltl]|uniref:Uncharacterized protein n=1 Tax=Pleurodeles waltl TaxID=8319 RepID=A0AAV7W164_PLEWA|nr:hypothetical protein NDU88_001480 [Pleurodeles waltl]
MPEPKEPQRLASRTPTGEGTQRRVVSAQQHNRLMTVEPESLSMVAPDKDRSSAAWHRRRASMLRNAAASEADLPEAEWGEGGISEAIIVATLLHEHRAGKEGEGEEGSSARAEIAGERGTTYDQVIIVTISLRCIKVSNN